MEFIDPEELTQHYERWKEFLDLAASTGAQGFPAMGEPRGIAWSPSPGCCGWTWLDQVAEYTRGLELTIVVDLMHYGTPLWLENEFVNAEYPERVAAYALHSHQTIPRCLDVLHSAERADGERHELWRVRHMATGPGRPGRVG